MELDPLRADLKAFLERFRGAAADPGSPRGAALVKVCGKMFAILSTSRNAYLTLKCDPHLIDILKEQYQGVGKRTHLDARFWITIDLKGDVPLEEIHRLAAGSYALVVATLTKKQRAEVAAS